METFYALVALLVALIVVARIVKARRDDRDAEEIYDAFLEIADEARKDLKIAYPGILTSDIARHAMCSKAKAFSVLSEMSTQDPPMVHRLDDRWYEGRGWK